MSDLGQQFRTDARSGDLFDRVHPVAQFVDAGALALLDVVQAAGQRAHGGLDLAECLGRLGPHLLFEPAQALVPLAQLLGDVVDAAAIGLAGLVLPFQPTDQSGDGLVDALDGDGRPALGGFQPGGDGVDRGAETLQLIFAGARPVGVVHPAAASAAVDAVGGMGAAGQGREAAFLIVAVFHDDGVQPLAQRHARATGEVLGDLARLGLNALHAPRRRGCAH